MKQIYYDFYSKYVKLKYHSKRQSYGYCPFHNDKNPSFSVNLITGQWMCHSEDISGDIFTFIKKMNIPFEELPQQIKEMYYKDNKLTLEGVYSYFDEDGNLVYEEMRYRTNKGKKRIYFRRFTEDGKEIWNLEGVKKVLYNLPDLLKCDSLEDFYVFIVEGPNKVEVLKEWDFVAVSNPNGASGWKDEFKEYFRGENVIVIPDNDYAGCKYAKKVCKSLKEVANSIKILRLPDLDFKEDIIDWINKGGTKKKFWELVSSNSIEWKEDSSLEPIYISKTSSLTKKGFFKIPNNSMSYKLKPTVRAVYDALCYFRNNGTNFAKVKIDIIKKYTCISTKLTIINALKELEKYGLIKKERYGNRNKYLVVGL
jgi:putative DNA primase/helicase